MTITPYFRVFTHLLFIFTCTIFSTYTLANDTGSSKGGNGFSVQVVSPFGQAIEGRYKLSPQITLQFGLGYSWAKQEESVDSVGIQSPQENDIISLSTTTISVGGRSYFESVKNLFFIEGLLRLSRVSGDVTLDGFGDQSISGYGTSLGINFGAEYFIQPYLSVEGKIGINAAIRRSENEIQFDGNINPVVFRTDTTDAGLFASGISVNFYW